MLFDCGSRMLGKSSLTFPGRFAALQAADAVFALCHGLMVSPTLGPNFISDFYFACYRTRTTALWVSRSSKSESACAFAAACKRMYVTACNGVCGLRRTYGTRVTIENCTIIAGSHTQARPTLTLSLSAHVPSEETRGVHPPNVPPPTYI